MGETGLRQRKKERTHQAISEAAITLFLERGFDHVSVAEVAAAAEVSKPTLFKYFATKEDLVLHRIADHRGEAAAVVRNRTLGETPVAALRRHFLAGLERRDPVTGLNDSPAVLAYHQMVFTTPSLLARVFQHTTDDEDALAAALAEVSPSGRAAGKEDLHTARLAAAQVIAVHRVLARANWRQLSSGRPAAQLHPQARTAAEHAFTMLSTGLPDDYR